MKLQTKNADYPQENVAVGLSPALKPSRTDWRSGETLLKVLPDRDEERPQTLSTEPKAVPD